MFKTSVFVILGMICLLCWVCRDNLQAAVVQAGIGQADPANAADPANPDLVVTNVDVLDVVGGALLADQQILISGNRIIELRAARPLNVPATTTVLDGQGACAVPGLIDLHSHLLLHPYNEASWNDQVLVEPLELRVIRATRHARDTLNAGFTTLRDLGTEGAAFADVALRQAIDQGMIPGPRLLASTKAIVTTGGYGPMGFDPRVPLPKGAQVADGVDACRRVAREQIAAGADWIKVYADYRRRPGDSSTPTFSLDELKAIVDEANSAGLPTAAHATTDEGIRRAVLAGVATIEHGYDASPETLALMKTHQVVLCPTLAASEAMAIYAGWQPGTPDPPRVVAARQLIKRALSAGVTVACGSDVGVFAHGTNYRELELMYAYGMPLEDVLRSATSTASRVLRRDTELGQIKAGYLADLILVEHNPFQDLATLRQPTQVIKDGQIVTRPVSPK